MGDEAGTEARSSRKWRSTMPRTRKGFTLIELLIVVVIIGILAAIAIPKFADTKRKAYIAAMKSDLKNMVSSTEAYYADNGTYEGYEAPTGSSGVTLSVDVNAATGWVGMATHASASGAGCVIGVGSSTPTGLSEGQPGGVNCK
jgi:prepilin-type N-terminal cleavage/methylation domain-containing protein